MNREDIIRMAREAECEETWGADAFRFGEVELERFVAIIAAAEREAIAQMFDDPPPLASDDQNKQGGCLICGFTPAVAAKVIRARGQR